MKNTENIQIQTQKPSTTGTETATTGYR
ncbi:hypothetical protein CCACVL1_21680 [Corchorus capsularis]|uniref:Uncharacterized protein n=1 Tax=Corchorus capsularis TaxID=210143 RepID=A0A1R3H2G7_COCAP|nr:hypothetical protein CCACVL1_21680 [Corchorus capsularis]